MKLKVSPLSSALGAEIFNGNYSNPLNNEEIELIYKKFKFKFKNFICFTTSICMGYNYASTYNRGLHNFS